MYIKNVRNFKFLLQFWCMRRRDIVMHIHVLEMSLRLEIKKYFIVYK